MSWFSVSVVPSRAERDDAEEVPVPPVPAIEEVVRNIEAGDRVGINTVFFSSEDDATDGAPTVLAPLPEADAIVSTSVFKNVTLVVPEAPPVSRVIDVPRRPCAAARPLDCTTAPTPRFPRPGGCRRPDAATTTTTAAA